jgi:type III secretion protein N (ATPase)
MLIDSGVYKPGTNAALDQAIACREALLSVLQQGQTERVSFDASITALQQATTGARHHA